MEQEQLQENLAQALRSDDFATVERLARQAVEQYEGAAWGYYFLGEAFLQQGDYERAEICLAKAIELDEDNDDYRLRFAANKEAQALWEDACIVYAIVLEHNPSNLHALLGLAKIFWEVEKDGEQALEYIERAEATIAGITPSYLVIFKTKVLLEMERYADALAEIDRLLDKADVEEAYALKLSLLSRMEGEREEEIIHTHEGLCKIGRAHV